MKEVTNAALKLRNDIFAEVGDPLIVALNEGEILILIGLQGLELSVLPAGLVLLEVSCNVV